MSDWGHDWIEKGRRFQGLIAQAKVWETTCDAGGPLMIFIPQGFPKEIPSRAADASEYPGQREGCARGGSSSRQKEEEGEDTHREQEISKHVALTRDPTERENTGVGDRDREIVTLTR